MRCSESCVKTLSKKPASGSRLTFARTVGRCARGAARAYPYEAGRCLGKAASLAAEWQAAGLASDIQNAFYRLNKGGLEDDPQCWGKVGIIKALFELAWQDADVYLQGCKTVQLEPVYGGKEDSAVAVRTASIQILVQLPAVATAVVTSTLADLLADPSSKVRAAAARASVCCPVEVAQPLLRLKIRLGDEPRVLGTCFDALLALAPTPENVALVLASTHSKSDVVQAEALASLASSSLPEAVDAVTRTYPTLTDTQLRRVLLTALGGSPTEAALEFLCYMLEQAPLQEATWALQSLKPKLHDDATRRRILEHLKARQDDELLHEYQQSLYALSEKENALCNLC